MNRLAKISTLSLVTAAALALSGCLETNQYAYVDVSFQSPQPNVVKAMSFNIRTNTIVDVLNSWSDRKDLVVDIIADNAPDVMGLQEARNAQIDHIQQSFPQYEKYSAGRSDGKKKGEACPIFFRKDKFTLADSGTFWFSSKPDKPGSMRLGNLFPRICSWVHLIDKKAEKGFYVYNLHLDSLSQSSRQKSVEQLAATIANRPTKEPFIVMGDFNMEIDNPAMNYLQKIGHHTPYPKMTDAWLSINYGQQNDNEQNCGSHHKFSGRTNCPRIDHMPISENARALEVIIDQRNRKGKYPSDHYPLIAKIKLI